MAVVSDIESTPNPSSFLVKLSEPLAGMEEFMGSLKGKTFTKRSQTMIPTEVASILDIVGIESVYAMATGVTINKKASAKWEIILPLVMTVLGMDKNTSNQLLQGLLVSEKHDQDNGDSNNGQVRIRMQISNKIPIQIEGIGFLGTIKRLKLSPKFQESMTKLMNNGEDGMDFFASRKWVDRGVRYLETTLDNNGKSLSEHEQEQVELDTILQSELEEVDAAYSANRLATIVAESRFGETKQREEEEGKITPTPSSASGGMTDDTLLDLETVSRFFDLAKQGDMEALSMLAKFVTSHQGSVAARRNALAFLGGTGDTNEKDYVFHAIVSALQKEKNPIMRRTAGDALSDLGDSRAVQPAITALGDRSKLVQWRAARILGELGDSVDVVAVLKQALFSDKYAFEVAFEIKNALRKVKARVQSKGSVNGINGATPNTGPIWKQIKEGLDAKS
jgi:hypothetical protein